MIDLKRRKLLDAIVFFVENTRHCGAVKLFKLLYFLDMLNFRETGHSVTGLRYKALPYGPVPTTLYEEFNAPKEDLAATVLIESPPKEAIETEPKRTKIKPKSKWKDLYLSVREKRIVSDLADIFKEASADDMTNVSHAPRGPWEKAKNRNPGKWVEEIDYLDCSSPTLAMGRGRLLRRELLIERAKEFEEI